MGLSREEAILKANKIILANKNKETKYDSGVDYIRNRERKIDALIKQEFPDLDESAIPTYRNGFLEENYDVFFLNSKKIQDENGKDIIGENGKPLRQKGDFFAPSSALGRRLKADLINHVQNTAQSSGIYGKRLNTTNEKPEYAVPSRKNEESSPETTPGHYGKNREPGDTTNNSKKEAADKRQQDKKSKKDVKEAVKAKLKNNGYRWFLGTKANRVISAAGGHENLLDAGQVNPAAVLKAVDDKYPDKRQQNINVVDNEAYQQQRWDDIQGNVNDGNEALQALRAAKENAPIYSVPKRTANKEGIYDLPGPAKDFIDEKPYSTLNSEYDLSSFEPVDNSYDKLGPRMTVGGVTNESSVIDSQEVDNSELHNEPESLFEREDSTDDLANDPLPSVSNGSEVENPYGEVRTFSGPSILDVERKDTHAQVEKTMDPVLDETSPKKPTPAQREALAQKAVQQNKKGGQKNKGEQVAQLKAELDALRETKDGSNSHTSPEKGPTTPNPKR